MIILLSACITLAEPTLDVSLAGTQAAQTVVAVLTEQAAPAPTATRQADHNQPVEYCRLQKPAFFPPTPAPLRHPP
jgi:hypothetical protein